MELENVTTDEQQQPASTYEWLLSNPFASTCGSKLSTLYCASRDYNTATKFTIGGVEYMVNYAAGTAKPVYEKVVEKLDTPLTAVDKAVVGQLEKLEVKYPIIGEEPEKIATKSKETIVSTLQAGQEALVNTRAARAVGYGADVTLTATECLVEKVLPEVESEDSDEEDDEEETPPTNEEEEPPVVEKKKKSFFGLRKRKSTKQEESKVDEEVVTVDDREQEVSCYEVEPVSRSTRVYNLSQSIGSRSLRQLRRVQKQCMSSLEKLKTTIDILYYTQLASTKVGEQKEVVMKALKSAEEKFTVFWSKKCQKENGLVTGTNKDEEDEDIKWLLESGKKKDLYHQALEYAQGISKSVFDMMQSVSGVASYLPQTLRDRAESTLKQAKDVYSTLKTTNMHLELPSFVLSHVSEIVGTQIIYCKELGDHIKTTLKTRFGSSPQNASAVVQDEDEVSVGNEKEPPVEEDEEAESGDEET